MMASAGKRLVFTAKLLLAAALITLLFWKVDVVGTFRAIAGISVFDVTLLLLISAVIILISCMKWQLFLVARGVQVPLWGLFKLYLAGYFFNNFTPSNVGGDAARSLVLGKQIGSQSNAFGTVFLERFTGFIGLIAVGLVTAAIQPSLVTTTSMALFLAGMGALLLGMLAFLLCPPLHRLLLAMSRSQKLPRPFRKIEKFLDVVFFFRDKPKVLLLALLYSLAFHLFTVVNTAVVCRALGIEVDVCGLAIAVPMVLLVAAVPLTPNAIGVIEGAFVFFLGNLGVLRPEALAVGVLLRGKNLVVALFGGAVLGFLKMSKSSGAAVVPAGVAKRREWLRAASAIALAFLCLWGLIAIGSPERFTRREIDFNLEGTVLRGDWYLPRAKPKAAILLLHGSNPRARHLALYPALSEALAARGFAVCNLDQRGHGDSDGPERVRRAEDLPFVDDARRVMKRLHEHEAVSTCETWVMVGHSFGGGVAVAAGMTSPDTDLVVSISPGRRLRERFIDASDEAMLYVEKRKSRDLGLKRIFSAQTGRKILASYDVGQFRGETLSKPLLLIEGGDESDSDLVFTRELVGSMLGDVRHVVIPDVNHYFGTGVVERDDGEKERAVVNRATRKRLVERMASWIEKNQ